MSQKLRFWPKMAIFSHVRPNLGKMRIFLKKKGLYYLFTLIVPKLHAKFWENPRSGFRDQFVTDVLTDKGDIIEPVAFAGSKTDSFGLNTHCAERMMYCLRSCFLFQRVVCADADDPDFLSLT